MSLVAYYEVELKEEMIVRAIKTRQIKNFLYCVWAFNKNFEYIDEEEEDGSSDDDDSGE